MTKTGTMTKTGGPYPGTRPFSQADHDRFFGRVADSAALAERWRSNRLTIGVGQAGIGKTSLLQAGVMPLMADKRAEILPLGRVSYGPTYPFGSLPEHNPYTLALLRSWSLGETVTRLVGLRIRDFVRRHTERYEGKRLILAAIDQCEELLGDSGPHRQARRRFLGELAEATQEEPGLHVLLLTRDEAYDVIAEGLGCEARYDIAPLTRQGAIDAVEKPVTLAGRSFDSGAAERIVASLQVSRNAGRSESLRYDTDDHVIPSLLQVVCARLWDSLPADLDLITVRDVSKYGDAGMALAAYCGYVMAAVANDHDVPAAKLRSWLLSTFITEYGTRGMVYEGQVTTAGMPNAVLRALEDWHLLSVQPRSGLRWYELQADSLIDPVREAPEQSPPYVQPKEYLESAGRASVLGDPDLADRFADEALRLTRETDLRTRAEANSLLGNVALERGKPGEAEKYYGRAAALYEAARDTGMVARHLAAVGQMQLAQGQAEDAVQQMRAAVNRLPNDPVLQTELGVALWGVGDGRGAAAVLTAVLALDGGNAGALRVRGEILAYLGDARDALRDLDRVELRETPSTRAARGLALAQLGDRPAASRELEDAIAEAPRNGPVLLYAAWASSHFGDKGESEKFARHALDAVDPPLTPAHRTWALAVLDGAHRKPQPG